MFPSISASTAVLQSESIGISPFLRCFSCRLNSLVTRKAKVYVGTASKCLYGVFIVFSSSFIVNLTNDVTTYGEDAEVFGFR